MREIKFRAWMSGEIHDDMVIVWDYPKERDMGAPLNTGIQNFLRFGEGKHILMQYTGLKDKDGKEIYEGDIVRQTDYCGAEHKVCNHTWVIKWNQEASGFEPFCHNASDQGTIQCMERDCCCYAHEYEMTVIGNIYENPELLEI